MYLAYFRQDDVIHLVTSEEPECRSVELSPNITLELNKKDQMIGLEILKASSLTTHYYQATDSVYIEVSSKPSVDSKEMYDGVVFDYDAGGDLVGIDIN